jgi:hypothetical protein
MQDFWILTFVLALNLIVAIIEVVINVVTVLRKDWDVTLTLIGFWLAYKWWKNPTAVINGMIRVLECLPFQKPRHSA